MKGVAGGCDRACVFDSVPADHDDDDGGADGHAADRVVDGGGRGGAAAARRRGRRGISVLAIDTLYVTPVVYTYMDSLNHRVGGWASRFGQKREHEVVPAGTSRRAEPRVVAKSSGDAAD